MAIFLPLSLEAVGSRLSSGEALHSLIYHCSIADQLANKVVRLAGLYARSHVLDLREPQFEVSPLCIWANPVYRALPLGEGWIVLLISEEIGSHYFMDVVFVLADWLPFFHEFWLEELLILLLIFGRWRGFLRGLNLPVNNFIDWHIGVLILILL